MPGISQAADTQQDSTAMKNIFMRKVVRTPLNQTSSMLPTVISDVRLEADYFGAWMTDIPPLSSAENSWDYRCGVIPLGQTLAPFPKVIPEAKGSRTPQYSILSYFLLWVPILYNYI